MIHATAVLFISSCLAAGDESAPLRDQWDVAYIGSDRIGYFHVESKRVSAASGKPVIHTRQLSHLAIRRFGQEMQMQSISDFFELEDGRLYSTKSQSLISNEVTTSTGRIIAPGKFQVVVESKGAKVDQTLDWPGDIVGPYAQDRSLRTQPLAKGQTRRFRTFLPELNVVATRTLVAEDTEPAILLHDKKQDLLKVIEKSDKVAIESTLWMDGEGEALKMTLPLADLQLTTYRTTKEDALRETALAATDLGIRTLIKPDQAIPNAHTTSSVTYRLSFADDVAASAIQPTRHQVILRRNQNVLDVKEQRNRPAPNSGTASSPGEEYLDTNTYVQPNQADIKRIALEVTSDVQHPWEKALRLEEWVSQNMIHQDFSIGFAPASEVIETRQGDCTEHAVLLCALCRAVAIPSRVAMGLVYIESSKQFGYHMWTEVFIGGDWYGIDGTIGHGGIGGGHIKIADGSLKGVDANSTFLPIFKVIGKLKIDVESIDAS